MSQKTENIIEKLRKKFDGKEEQISTRLSGLLHARDITYWDYIHTEALLSLQQPRTNFPDEMVFVIYHQITELYFKLILWEINHFFQIKEELANALLKCFNRITRYFDALSQSFTIMKNGMELEQYLQFRDTLTPASGFQSFQYRLIELQSTHPKNLVELSLRNVDHLNPKNLLDKLYWQSAGKTSNQKEKSPLLTNFLEKYGNSLQKTLNDSYQGKNLWNAYLQLSEKDKKNTNLIEKMKHFDKTVNITWVISHYQTAKQYIGTGAATGGSDWQKYMHPAYQKRIFFPDLYSKKEIESWGQDQKL